MFYLKISVAWKMGVTSGQCAEMLHYIVCWFSLPQRDLYMIFCYSAHILLFCFMQGKRIYVNDLEIFDGKCFLQPALITDLLLQNHGTDQLLPALLWDCLRSERS